MILLCDLRRSDPASARPASEDWAPPRMVPIAGLLLLTAMAAGCRLDMHDQPRYKPLAETEFFADGRAARPVVEGTVARGQMTADEHYFQGKVGGRPAAAIPVELSRELLERGRQRYDIYCSPCHGPAGYGDGMIVQRGLRPPPSFHIERLRAAPPGYVFDVITNGFGAMYPYASRVNVHDRWAIVAYLQALQLSQNATPADVPPGLQIEERP